MSTATVAHDKPFRHEAMLYRNLEEFLHGTLEFIADGLAGGEPILVVLKSDKNELLKTSLGDDAGRVRFADMAQVGANPARIIPAWHEFAGGCSAEGRPFRGIGEPIWAGRDPDELVECQRHEALLNLAFAGTPAFRLMCPYDVEALDPDVLDEARRSHLHIIDGSQERVSPDYRDVDQVAAPFDLPLSEPFHVLDELAVAPGSLERIRETVTRHARESSLGEDKVDELVLAVNEVATNSLVHGGGRGTLRMWLQDGTFVCEVRDSGRIDDPLVGRIAPSECDVGGRGLWLATQLCDLIQVRTFAAGTVVRLHMRPR